MSGQGAYQIPKSLIHSILSATASGVIVALLSFLGLALLGWATGGGLVRWLGGLTEGLDPQNFSSAFVETEIPGSSGAKFCALTAVYNMPTGGQCYVKFDKKNKIWVFFNKGNSDCTAACLK